MANGLSPGIEEQSEYFDATENPLFKDKRQEQDDEDSGVDNASQILRERSVSEADVSFEVFQLKPVFFLLYRRVPDSTSIRYRGSRWPLADSVWPNVCRGQGT